jgi:hypothetical protein
VFSSAVDEAVEEALHPPKPGKSRDTAKKQSAKKAAPRKSAKSRKEAPTRTQADARRTDSRTEEKSGQPPGSKGSGPPPAVNEPLAFINFVAAFAVGSTVEGEVVSFTSHGAMVDVPLPGGGALHCYIPLTAMGSPPPNKARQVLKKGEVRPFVLAGLDPPRRVAELALPSSEAGAKTRAGGAKAAPTATRTTRTKAAPPAKKAAAKKAAAKKAATPAKKAIKRATTPAKKAGASKSTKAKKAPAKKAAKARHR